MSKYAFFLVIPLFCFFKKETQNKMIKITVLKVGFDYTTPADVTCDQFETAWADMIDTIDMTNNEQIKSLITKSLKAKVAKQPYVDARAKIFVNYESGKTDTFCIGTTSIFYRNGRMLDYGNKDLSNYLWDLPYDRR